MLLNQHTSCSRVARAETPRRRHDRPTYAFYSSFSPGGSSHTGRSQTGVSPPRASSPRRSAARRLARRSPPGVPSCRPRGWRVHQKLSHRALADRCQSAEWRSASSRVVSSVVSRRAPPAMFSARWAESPTSGLARAPEALTPGARRPASAGRAAQRVQPCHLPGGQPHGACRDVLRQVCQVAGIAAGACTRSSHTGRSQTGLSPPRGAACPAVPPPPPSAVGRRLRCFR
jgi:hypothetical protein